MHEINQNNISIKQHENRYQLVRPHLNPNSSLPSNQVYSNINDVLVEKKTNAEYFASLKHFRALLYSGEGTPFLLSNDHWGHTLGCVLFLDVVFVFCLILFIFSANNHLVSDNKVQTNLNQGTKNPDNDVLIIVLSSVVCLLLINISYFLCQFMNPGIRNITTITEEEFNRDGKKFCS